MTFPTTWRTPAGPGTSMPTELAQALRELRALEESVRLAAEPSPVPPRPAQVEVSHTVPARPDDPHMDPVWADVPHMDPAQPDVLGMDPVRAEALHMDPVQADARTVRVQEESPQTAPAQPDPAGTVAPEIAPTEQVAAAHFEPAPRETVTREPVPAETVTGALRAHRRLAPALLIAVSGWLVLGLTSVPVLHAVWPVAVFGFALTVPGTALVRLLPVTEPLERAVLAVALSLSAAALASEATYITHVLQPAAVLAGLATLCSLAAAAELTRGVRRP